MQYKRPAICLIVILFSVISVYADKLYGATNYHDRTSLSQNRRYRIDAKIPVRKSGESPDVEVGFIFADLHAQHLLTRSEKESLERAPREKRDSQRFSYTLTDFRAGKSLWTRKQGQEEGPCVSVFVNDDGYTVIYTGLNELIVVSPTGQDAGKINILNEAFTQGELTGYFNSGNRWTRGSMWYFLKDKDTNSDVFVIKWWWGKRIIVDLLTGKLCKENEQLSSAMLRKEKEYILWVLDAGVKTRQNWEKKEWAIEAELVFYAAFAAGEMEIKEAIPFLQKLQDVSYITSKHFSDSASEPDYYEPNKGEIYAAYFGVFGIRQASHFALRRMGQKPGRYDCTQYYEYRGPLKIGKAYSYLPLKTPREKQIDKVLQKQSPEDVLTLLGAPDYAESRCWYYEMETEEPFTLCILWENNKVFRIQKLTTPFWKSNNVYTTVLLN